MASSVKFHPCVILTYYLIGLLLVTLCGHNVYLVISALIRFIPSSILKIPAHTVKFLVIQKNVQVWDQVHCSPQNSCNYVSGYASGLSKGVLAKEKVTITSTSGQELVLETHVPFNSSGKVSKGNICIDSGSPPLTLPPDFYSRLEVEVKKQISIDPIKNETLTGTWFAIELKLLMKMDQN
ncbi:hypothetical protein CFP56_010860 [Quercus suber]|uniref:Uncharacterized protein n=1 Tax=Quercus suber TaxID=58331 RepID=A0AAW0L0Q5_QUESU